jgi:hypothetical protein
MEYRFLSFTATQKTRVIIERFHRSTPIPQRGQEIRFAPTQSVPLKTIAAGTRFPTRGADPLIEVLLLHAALTHRRPLRKLALTPSAIAVVVFFAGLLALGLTVYKDFGVSWDEPVQIKLGLLNFRYILHQDPALLSYQDRYYGPVFELALLAGYRTGMDSRQVYLNRHLITFLCFFAGCLAFFWLAKRFTRNTWLALIGTAFLVLSPRIFADAFYNSKDVPFLVFYTFSILSMLWFLDRPGPLTGLIHGGVTAAMLAVRLPGLVIPALTVFGLGIELFTRRSRLRRGLTAGAIYLAALAGFLVLTWPILWHDPLGGFVNAVAQMSRYPHPIRMLYLGQLISSLSTPWHYIPTWIGITTPLLYLALFAVGLGVTAYILLKERRKGFGVEKRDLLLVLGCLFLPLLTVIALHSVLYDAWRQMFFVYPPFLLVALVGLRWAWNALSSRLPRGAALGVAAAILAVGMLPTAAWMLANHPYENVYFNRLAGADMQAIGQRFMLDYWGLSYRRGLEYIAHTDPSPHIPVAIQTDPGRYNLDILPAADRARIYLIQPGEQPKYIVSNHYPVPEDPQYPYPEVYAVQVGNAKLMSVYRVTP